MIDDYRVPAIERRRRNWHELTVDEAAELIRSHIWRNTRDGLHCVACGIGPSSSLAKCQEPESVKAARRAELEIATLPRRDRK